MITIKYDKGALLHAYQKHHLNKSRIASAINKGIRNIAEDPKNNSFIIFTTSMIAVAVDHQFRLKTAFQYKDNYYNNKIKLGKIL